MFVDEVKVYAAAGHGGRGCVAFQREAFRPKGGPSGGNGGKGADVVLEADHDTNNLVAQHFQPHLRAKNGLPGKGKGMDGRSAEDLVVKVPCGTKVWRLPPSQGSEAEDAGEGQMRQRAGERALEIDLETTPAGTPEDHPRPERPELIADLTEHGQRFVLCRGGRGGLGNRNFATSVRQAPRFAQPGEAGEEGRFLLELSLLADIGLVGYPNAGKSTLLSAISKAHPKIAPYPFTTLHPQVGVVEYDDFFRLTVCDVPGLIKGAHENVGLGHAFLRHIARCRVLVFVIDMAGSDGRLPWEDYRSLLHELECYDAALLEKPRLVGANKMDESAAKGHLAKFRRRIRGVPILPLSAGLDVGLDRFREAIRKAAEQPAAPIVGGI